MNDQQNHLAARQIVVSSLSRGGMGLDAAERWCDLWDEEAVRAGIRPSETYWDEGRRWIDRHRAAEMALAPAPPLS